MKNGFKVAAVIGGIAAMGLIYGCGDDNKTYSYTATGKVTKAPVYGETVVFGIYSGTKKSGTWVPGFRQYSTALGKKASEVTTDKNGNFVFPAGVTGLAIKTRGVGSYTDIGSGKAVAAPALTAPAGSLNVTGLTTLVALDTTGNVKAKLQSLGINYDADLTTITTANQAAVTLNEAFGDILQSAGNGNVNAIAANLIAVLNGLSATQLAALTPATVASTIIGPAVQAAVTAGTITAAQQTTINAAVAATVTQIIPGHVLTGATGGTSSGTGTGQ